MKRNTIFLPDWIPKFLDDDLEKSFRLYHEYQMIQQILITLLFYGLSQLILLPFEYYEIKPVPMVRIYLIVFRLLMTLICVIGWIVISKKWINDIRLSLIYIYNLLGLTLLLLSSMISYQFHLNGQLKDCPYLFFWGSWSLGNSLFFSFMCFNCSGLLFTEATTVLGVNIFLFSTLPFLFSTSFPPLSYSIFLLPAFLLFEMLFVHSVEMETRTRYLSQLEAGRDLCRQDKLIRSILPADISAALKGGHKKIEKLASYYSDVTILFCYIVDFTEHSFVTHPHDTVELCRRIVSVFDRIVEQTGAYKVENIADTYMACAGCPIQSGNHTLVIARTALAMMQAAETRCWRWPDSSPVQLKIGIHTGAVTAGVIGTKSYSYHLFGDAVNTASRMCSHSLPGKILLSAKTHQKLSLSYEEIFRTSEKGETQVKGKGLMKLYWLDGYIAQYNDIFTVNLNHQSDKRAYTDRYAQLRASESFKIMVNRYTLHFVEANSSLPLVETNSSKRIDPASNLLRDRRGSQVGREAAAAVSAGLNRMLSRGIENYSPEQHEVELTSGRMSMTPDNHTSSRSEGSRKYFSTVRNFGSSVDDESDRQESESFSERYYRLHMGTTSKMTENKKPREFIDENEDVESQVPPNPHVHDLSDSSSSSSQEVTKETLIKMEQSFQKYSDLKSIPIQIHTLSISAIYSFLNVLNILLENKGSWPFALIRFFLFSFSLLIARYLSNYQNWNQTIFVILEIFILITKMIESILYQVHYGSVHICILFLLFATIFLRIRFHYVLIYVLCLGCTLLIRFIILNILHQESHYDVLAGVYSIITMIFALWLIYIQELIARTEYVDLFIMRQEMLKSEHLLSNMLPTSIHAFKLLKGEFILDELHDVTLLYSDIKGFTPLSSSMHPIKLCELLNEIYSSFDKHLNEFGMYKVDIIGDAFVVIGGIPGYKDYINHAKNTILFAFYMLEDIKKIKQKYNVDLEIRIGIHSGGCSGSVISENKPRYLIWGPNSIIANHLEATGIPGLVHVSETTMKKIDSISLDEYGIEVIERGNSMDAKKKVLLNNENTYLLSCKDFSEINILLSGKSEQSQMNLKTHQSRFAASIAQIPFRRLVGNRIRHLTVDTATHVSGNSSPGRIHVDTETRRERAASDPHGARPRRVVDSPHSNMLQNAIISSYFGGHSGRRSASSVSTDSHADSDHNSPSSPLRKRLDSNESITSNNSHTSSPRAVTYNRIQPFEEIQTNFGTGTYQYHEVTYQLPKGWNDDHKCLDRESLS